MPVNRLLWTGMSLLASYYLRMKMTLSMASIKKVLNGVALYLVSYLLGFCALVLLLAGSFFYFAELPQYFFAALWTALLCVGIGLTVNLFGNRLLRRHAH